MNEIPKNISKSASKKALKRAIKKECLARHQRKRNKLLHQQYCINEQFPGSNRHHVSMETIIFIPIKLHRSVSHNIFNGTNMDKINELAFEWFHDEWQRSNEIDISNMMG